MPELDPQVILDQAVGETTITERTAAALCCGFYKDFDTGELAVTFPAGWNELARERGAYDGIALHHPASRSLVFVNRGTETTDADWYQNIGAALLAKPGAQIPGAARLVKAGVKAARDAGLAVDSVLFTGHSLGGALAEAQALLSPSLLPAGLQAGVRALGLASAGFGAAVKAYALDKGLTVHGAPASIITHYVRKEDLVPRHPGRQVFGREVKIASVFETRLQATHKSTPRWTCLNDRLGNHSSRSHLTFLDEPGASRHVWYSRNAKDWSARSGATPGWRAKNIRPADW